MPRIAQFVVAALLVAATSVVVLAWLLLLALSVSGGLMPWVAAGIVLYGGALFGLAAVLGIPGVLLSRHLAKHASTKLQRASKALAQICTTILAVGATVLVASLIWENIAARSRPGPCVSYRDAAASAALAASGASSYPDCAPPR